MSRPSQAESIFFAALEKKTTPERAEYLDRACGGDAALRHQVERLLDAHPQAKDFLARPAVDRDDFEPRDEAQAATSVGPTSSSDLNPQDPRAGTKGIETLDHERGEDVESALSFLQPSKKPGSLGRLAHYEVLEVLGNGGFGTVVKAFDEKLHRLVAIKLMSPLLAATSAPRRRFCARRGRPRPSATSMSSPSTPSRTGPSLTWSWSTSPGEPCSRSSKRPGRWS